MKPLLTAFLLFVALIIQATLIPLIAIKGIYPDLLLIIVVSAALISGKEQGAGLGFFAGLLQDFASGNIFGLNTLSKLATGFLAGVMERKVFKENILLPVLAVALATVFNSLFMMLLLFIMGYKVDLLPVLANIAYVLLYNAIIAIPLHKINYRILKKWMAE